MWRRRREPWEELSFLLNSLSPRNWFIRRWGLWLEEASTFAGSGALVTARENPQEGIVFMPGRTDNRSRSPR
ncbi:EC1118_1L10_2465p [Saccharomyces cerevisiae EC1118]|uniref:EC1118_1L10_2465p n=2 Tax=cellular organisms TaxID=131567 RepID=C8ZDC7_YEAS8|nr:EC1118_1L10_2465p [Saccharomyces cerevisiae EC1118]